MKDKIKLSAKARAVLETSANAMNGVFGKIQRKAIRVAPYIALAVPGGIALSKYFTAYNHLLDAQAAHGNLLVVAETSEQLKQDLIDFLPYLGKSADEIKEMAGPALPEVRELHHRLAEELQKDYNTEMNVAFDQAFANKEAAAELHNVFGFESTDALYEACWTNPTLQETVTSYLIDMYQDQMIDLANQIPMVKDEIVFNAGTEFETSVEHPYTAQAIEFLNQQVEELNAAQLDAQIGTVMVAATAAVGAGIYAAKKVYSKHKASKQQKHAEQDLER